jgi:excisionase family DNA binding protein
METKDKMLVEIDELCAMLGIGKNTAYSLLTSGEIDAFKIGTVWKIPVKSIEKYIDDKCKQYKIMCKLIN